MEKTINIRYSQCVSVALAVPARKGNAPYCRLWPVWFLHIFPHYLINGTTFEKSNLMKIKCVFWFYLQISLKYFHILRRILWGNVKNIQTCSLNTLRTGETDLRFYITTVQDGWRKSAFLTRACFPCTIPLIMQYIEPVSEWFCWRMFIETWPHSELNFRHRASSI